MRKTILTLILVLAALTVLPLSAIAAEYDPTLAQPGDEGCDVEVVLKACRLLGTLPNLPDGEQVYRDEYINGVKALEKKLKLEADGVIHLSEFQWLEQPLTELSKGSDVKKLLEQLFDLGYITSALPERHDTWEKKYTSAVRKAEKELQLHEDGILSQYELTKLNQIFAVRVKAPDTVRNLKATDSSGKVNLSWSAVKGAAYYRIYRENTLIATVYGKTSYQDVNAKQGHGYTYHVSACKYSLSSHPSDVYVYVNPVYKSYSIKQIMENGYKMRDVYVQFGSTKVSSRSWKGKDVHVTVYVTINGSRCYATLILEDYNNWDWNGQSLMSRSIDTISGKGQVTRTGSELTIVMTSVSFTWK